MQIPPVLFVLCTALAALLSPGCSSGSSGGGAAVGPHGSGTSLVWDQTAWDSRDWE